MCQQFCDLLSQTEYLSIHIIIPRLCLIFCILSH